MLDHIRRLVAHLAWADDRSLRSLRATSSPDPEAVAWLAHVLGAEEVWLARLEQREASAPVWPAIGLDDCEALARDVHARLERYLDALDPAQLDRRIAYRNSAGVPFESRVVDILLQIVTHGAYHRGQIAAAVRQAGVAPLYTDYIAFVRDGAPATRADAAARDTGPR